MMFLGWGKPNTLAEKNLGKALKAIFHYVLDREQSTLFYLNDSLHLRVGTTQHGIAHRIQCGIKHSTPKYGAALLKSNRIDGKQQQQCFTIAELDELAMEKIEQLFRCCDRPRLLPPLRAKGEITAT
ncbi:hypothetical protein SELMODRAFT_417129 [Selaginella moellendorffii]|uniref:Uncharacterized protein n=1 Tax=Selaginella moellendorffii TaxID=88036 RepID=D8S1G4_SELML|nr:hypothetical protein SELMODRAFT_417129 [Selaginella moellendorffii]